MEWRQVPADVHVLSPLGSTANSSSVLPLPQCAEGSTVPSNKKATPGGPSLCSISSTCLGTLLEQHGLWWGRGGKQMVVPLVANAP